MLLQKYFKISSTHVRQEVLNFFFFKKLSLCNQETSYNSATLKHWQIDTLNSLQLC